ncbi:MAG: AraC family transcriptional regulator, partial [Lachnospiraceae bacterium]|nr:AraC family transcriptional regulator [Lachnospiraceae bacterium]
KPGILAVIRPGEYHSCGATEDSDLEFWALSFSPAGEDDTLYQSITDGRCVSASFEDYPDYVQGAFRYIHMLAAGEQPGDSHSKILQGQILSLIQFAGIMRQLHPLDVPAGDLPLREMLDWISEHFAENISLSSLSREFAMSTSHLSRSFFAAFQISPINYLIEYRLTRASDLLIHTDLPIHTVAARVGYGNTYYFSNLFAKRTGCTPQEFRYRCTHSDTMPEDVSM